MLCSRCNKRPAVVFLSNNASKSDSSQGLCIMCAKEMGIKPVTDIMDKMGISNEDLEVMQDQLDEFMNTEEFKNLENSDFSQGGAATFPSFFNNVLNSSKEQENKSEEKISGKQKKEKNKQDKKNKKRKNIDLYCYDLTKKAKNGEIDQIIGRTKEISRVIHILSRRTKNNPCLIGEPGVGKTAIAEGLAIKIVNGDVPYRLKKKEVYLLDLTSLVAGTQFRGQFESRIKGLIEEVKEANNIILFIDEVHNLVATGDAEGTMNAANILKPALSRGEIQVIGATTFNEYRKYIEKDSALERRFQPVTILEPSIEDTIDVVIGIKSYYEKYHRVKISDTLIRNCVKISERYITDRFLPDKAIDLLDESCARCALRNKKLETYDHIKSEIETLKCREETISSSEDIDYEYLAKIRVDLACKEKKLEDISKNALNKYVTDDDIAHVIETWTGISASKVQENQYSKLSNIEDIIKTKIVGQDEGIKAVVDAVKRNRVQISPRRRPASFIFVGSTGVGKTELVKVLTKELFDSPDALIRLDMSEFMEKHSVSRIIGSPPGYVGYDEAGQLTEKVRRRPYSIILLDEIEKAHADVLNILLQILDEGRITDSHGKVVNFENTIIIMTSNAGSNKKDHGLGFGKTQLEMSNEKVLKALSEFLRPEFLSRLDDIIIFKDLDLENYKSITKIMLNEYVDVLLEKNIIFDYDNQSVDFISKKSIGGKNGARDLRNYIRKEVEDKIANAMVGNFGKDIEKISLTVNNKLEIKII